MEDRLRETREREINNPIEVSKLPPSIPPPPDIRNVSSLFHIFPPSLTHDKVFPSVHPSETDIHPTPSPSLETSLVPFVATSLPSTRLISSLTIKLLVPSTELISFTSVLLPKYLPTSFPSTDTLSESILLPFMDPPKLLSDHSISTPSYHPRKVPLLLLTGHPILVLKKSSSVHIFSQSMFQPQL